MEEELDDNFYDGEPIILSVEDEDGVEHQFEQLDSIEYEGELYVALTPYYEDAQDIIDDDGELIILRSYEEDDEFYLEPIENVELFDKLGKMFEDRLSEYFDFEEN